MHGGLELAEIVAREVARLRREIGGRIVAPEIPQPDPGKMRLVDEGVDGQKLDRRYSERFQVARDGGCGETGHRPAKLLRNLQVEHRVAAHVQLVDHRLVPRRPRRAVVAPGEGVVHHDAFRHAARIVAAIEGEVRARASDAVAEVGLVRQEGAAQRLGIRIEQQLVVVEPVPALRLIRARHAKAVELARPHIRHVAVPHAIRILRKPDAGRLAPSPFVEQADVDRFCILGEQGEVDSRPVPHCAERIGFPRPDSEVPGGHAPQAPCAALVRRPVSRGGPA